MSRRTLATVLLALALSAPGSLFTTPTGLAGLAVGRTAFDLASDRQAAPASQAASLPAERQFRAWLAAFNRGDREEYVKFLHEHFPSREARAENDFTFRESNGGFDLLKVESATATQVSCLVEERAWSQFARAELEVEAAPPHHITRLGLRVVPRPAEFQLPRLSEQELPSALRAKLEEAAAKERFSGSVLVGRNGKVVFSAAYGPADREKKISNTLDTRFRIGSMNKMFTATAILQLVQAGKIELDVPLGKYLTTYPNTDVASKVTIHYLLTHTGGTGDIFGPEFTAHRLELRTLDDYVKLYGQRALKFEPGAKWEYSNYGFLLLGVIVERVSGQSYYDYVRDHIFAPAGMSASGSEPEDQILPNRSKGYMREKGTWALNTETLPYRGTSAGGGYSTVGDLFRFANALTGHKLLDQRHTDLLTTGKAEAGGGGKYAYGFLENLADGIRSYGHSGGAPGMNGDLRIYPQSGWVVTALANTSSGAGAVTGWVAERLPK